MTSEIINTPAGPVKIEVRGSGIPILVLHGSPGGIDAARSMSRFLPLTSFRTICISRPGYLERPLDPNDGSIDHEADLLAGILDAVGVQRTGVLAWSGGGPVAYRLAVLHPHRVHAIVAIAAVSHKITVPKPGIREKLLFGTGFGERIVAALANCAPDHLVEEALAGESSIRGEALRTLAKQVNADPEQRRVVLEMSQTVNIGGKRKAGWYNDEANFARIESLELERVQCPVLLVHGDADTDVPPEHSYFAHAKLPNNTLASMEQGTHFALYAHPEAARFQEQALEWFSKYAEFNV